MAQTWSALLPESTANVNAIAPPHVRARPSSGCPAYTSSHFQSRPTAATRPLSWIHLGDSINRTPEPMALPTRLRMLEKKGIPDMPGHVARRNVARLRAANVGERGGADEGECHRARNNFCGSHRNVKVPHRRAWAVPCFRFRFGKVDRTLKALKPSANTKGPATLKAKQPTNV